MYADKCKKCEWTYLESDSPQIAGMPAICKKCGGDMGVVFVPNGENRDYTYELIVQCKENGAVVSAGFMMKNEDVLNPKRNKTVFKKKCFEEFAKVMTDDKKIAPLVMVN